MHQCRFCLSENTKKNGFIKEKQRFFCKDCKKNQYEIDLRKKYDEKLKSLAITMRLHGSGFRNIAKILSIHTGKKISYQLICHWINEKYWKNKDKYYENNHIKDVKNVDIIELDELYTFVKKKPKKILKSIEKFADGTEKKCYEYDRPHLRVWTAVDRKSMDIVAFTLGYGNQENAWKLLHILDKNYKAKLICTDGNFSYEKTVPTFSEHFIGKSETCLVESFNARLRHYIPSLRRRTMCYAKERWALYRDIFLWVNRKNFM